VAVIREKSSGYNRREAVIREEKMQQETSSGDKRRVAVIREKSSG